MTTIQIGVVGYGYWGPNLVRNYMETPDTQVLTVSDLEPEFSKSLKVYREVCTEQGIEPARPAPGRFTLRPDAGLHARMQVAADAQGLTVSKWALDNLIKALESA